MARAPDPELAERRRRQILDAAMVCFQRRGFHQASMQEICAEADLSTGALYRYFPSKTDIIAAIAEDHRSQVLAARAGLDPQAPLIETMLTVFAAAIDRMQDVGGALIGDVIAEAARDPELADRLRQGQAGLCALLESSLIERQRRGEIDPELDVAAAARALEAFKDGILLRLALKRESARETILADARMLVTRLLAPTGQGANISQVQHAQERPSSRLSDRG